MNCFFILYCRNNISVESSVGSKLLDIVDAKARVNHDLLMDFVSKNSISAFTEQAQHPFLVGKVLYDGEIKKRAGSQEFNTMKFSIAEVQSAVNSRISGTRTASLKEAPPEDEKGSGIANAIFMLRKKIYSTEPNPNVITIGRTQDNDIVIADYAISKQHAQIIIFKDKYFIVDTGSTNGTSVNEIPVIQGMKVQLSVNCTVSFGRICFVFAHPLQVYRGMHREIMGM